MAIGTESNYLEPSQYELEHGGYYFRRCTTVAEKELCRDFSFAIMLTARYGLMDLAYLDPDLWDVQRYTYILVLDGLTNSLVGTFRIDFDYDCSGFANLSSEIITRWKSGKVGEAGHYQLENLSLFQRISVFCGAWAAACAICMSKCRNTVYAQIRDDDKQIFHSMGWQSCGTAFTVDGWANKWWPMMMPLEIMINKNRREEYLGSIADGEAIQSFWNKIDSLRNRFASQAGCIVV